VTTPASEATPVRRSHPTRWAALVVGVVAIFLLVLLFTARTGERRTGTTLVGKAAPGVEGKVLRGDAFDLGNADRWVVVNFFATWCTPCIAEHPELRAFAEEHAKTGDARVISVVYDDQATAVQRFFDQRGGDWTVFDSDDGRTALDWGVAKIPESYLVSPNGTVVAKFISGVTQAQLDAVIASYDDEAGS